MEKALILKRPLLIGTYHKTGTVYMHRVFSMTCRKLGVKMFAANPEVLKPTDRDAVYISGVTRFHNDFLSLPDGFTGFRVIRDFRDIAISGARYHLTSSEKWLDDPNPAHPGGSYRNALLGAGSLRNQIRFEMHRLGRVTAEHIKDEIQAPHAMRGAELETVKLEKLNGPHAVEAFEAVLQRCGISGDFFSVAVAEFKGYAKNRVNEKGRRHIHNWSTEPLWTQRLDQALAIEMAELYQPLLVEFGYERDDSWIKGLPEHRPELDTPC